MVACAVATAARWVLALRLPFPGLWDSFWYDDVARHLARGQGLTSQIVWNCAFLPERLVHPAGEYWLPGASVVAALGYAGGGGLGGARSVLALVGILTILVGYVTARVARGTRPGGTGGASPERASDAAAFVALALGFSVPLAYFGVTVDTPLPFALAASLALLFLGLGEVRPWLALAAVPLALAAQLIRADGILLTALALAWCAWLAARGRASALLPAAAALLAGALWLPWLVRNTHAYGTPFPSSMLEAAALTDYSDLFRMKTHPSLAGVLAHDPWAIAAAKLRALGGNLWLAFDTQTLPLLPLAIAGLGRLVCLPIVRPHLVYAALLYLSMSLIFQFQSQNGSFVHSLPALYPVYFLAVALGLEMLRDWLDPAGGGQDAAPRGDGREPAEADKERAGSERCLGTEGASGGEGASASEGASGSGGASGGEAPGARRAMPVLARWVPRLALLWLALHLAGLVLMKNAVVDASTDLQQLQRCLSLWRGTDLTAAPARLMSNDILTVSGLTDLPGCQEPRDEGRDVVGELALRYGVTHMVYIDCARLTWRPWEAPIYRGRDGDFVMTAELHLSAPTLGIRAVRIYRFTATTR